jgi:hypothetical protein
MRGFMDLDKLAKARDFFVRWFYRFTLAAGFMTIINFAYMSKGIQIKELSDFPWWSLVVLAISMMLALGWFLDRVVKFAQANEREGWKRSVIWQEQFKRMDEMKKMLKDLQEQIKSLSRSC